MRILDPLPTFTGSGFGGLGFGVYINVARVLDPLLTYKGLVRVWGLRVWSLRQRSEGSGPFAYL